MDEQKRGCSMPYAVDKKSRIVMLVGWLVIVALSICTLLPSLHGFLNLEDSKILALRITAVLLIPVVLIDGASCIAELHLAPEGISVTLFGLTLRQIPADRIRLLSAVRERHKGSVTDLIAVSSRSCGELTELSTPKSSMIREQGEQWEGQWVYKYLLRRAGWFSRELVFRSWLLWLDWSPERLRLLRQTYPHAQWLDMSEDKLFEKQLNV